MKRTREIRVWTSFVYFMLFLFSQVQCYAQITLPKVSGDNIYPPNKQEVGRRLALIANKPVYKHGISASGPLYKSFRNEGHRIRIRFINTGTGLTTKGDKEVSGFAIAGKDKLFYWAKAYIEGNEVVVYSDKVTKPEAVRYAWAGNPGCNLLNSEGMPVVPFRTDEWKGITQKIKQIGDEKKQN